MYANHQTGLANPVILLSYIIFPGMNAFTAIFLSVFVLSGWAMYGYLRSIGIDRKAAMLGAVTYQLILGYIPVLDTLVIEKAMFPFLLYCGEKLVRAPAGKGAVWAILATVTLALVQTTSHAQEAVFISYLFGPYMVLVAGGQYAFPRGKRWSVIGNRVLTAAGIYIPALLVGAIQNLPTYEFYSLSTRMGDFKEQIGQATELEQSLSWIQSLMIAFPKFFGDYKSSGGNLEHYLLNYGYVGIFTLAAVPFAGWIPESKRQVWFYRIVGLIFFVAIINNWWYFEVLCKLPLFRISLQKPFSPLFFSIVVLGAHGFAFLLNPRPKFTPSNKTMGTTVLIWLALALGIGVLMISDLVLPGAYFTEEQIYVFGQIGIGTGIAAAALLVVSIAWRFINEKFPDDIEGRHSILLITTFILLLIIIGDLFPVKSHFNPFVDREDLNFETPLTEFLHANLTWDPGGDGPYRFGRSWKEILPPNTAMVYGLDDFGGYDSNMVRHYGELVHAVDSTLLTGIHWIETPRYRTRFKSNVWNMLGVKYLAAHPGHQGQFNPPEKWSYVFLQDNVMIVENNEVLPRFHIVHRIHETSDPDKALSMTLQIDPAFEGVVLKQPDSNSSSVMETDENTATDFDENIEIVDYQPEHVTVDATLETPGLLCFFDVWFPGWKVYVDGAEANLERVNYSFKGVYLPAGRHEVRFVYVPTWLKMAWILALTGLVLTILLSRPLSKLSGP
jgi:hypothetical protein